MRSITVLLTVLPCLLYFTNQVQSSEWIDVSDMTDSRLLRNRYRHSGSFPDQTGHKDYSGDGPLEDDQFEDSPFKENPYQDSRPTGSPPTNSPPADDHGDSIMDFIPKNPFPSTDSCLDGSTSDPDRPESPEELRARQLECISNKLHENTNIGENDANVEEEEDVEESGEKITKENNKENSKENTKKDTEKKTKKNEETKKRSASEQGDRPDPNKKYEANSKMLNTCLAKNKQLTEDLVCFRNLKSLYTRHFAKMQAVISSMQQGDQMIQIHPYSAEFYALVQTMNHENCLTVVDELEKVITKMDRLLYRIEPADWSKELTYAGISLSILACFYYIYRYLKIKYLVITLAFFIVYAHEYYYLMLAKRSEIAHNLHRHQINCRETGLFTSIWSVLFRGIQSTVSFKPAECDLLNEHYLYIDAVFKINPLEPVFTVVPKLFSKSVVILLENSAIAFGKFCAQLPFFHAYPILILFLALLVSIVYLLISWHVRLRMAEHDREIRLRQMAGSSTIGDESRGHRLTAPESAKSIGLIDPLGVWSDGYRKIEGGQKVADNSRRAEDSSRSSEENRRDAANSSRKEAGSRVLKHVNRSKALKSFDKFSRLDRKIRTSTSCQDDGLASVLRRTKSLDFIPVF